MAFQDNLVGNVLAAYDAGQAQGDRRRRRNALAAYAADESPNVFSPVAPSAPTQPVAGASAFPASQPSEGNFLAAALPAGTPSPALAPASAPTPGRPVSDGTAAIASNLTTLRRERARRDLIAMGDFDTVNNLRQQDAATRADTTRDAVAPMLRDGRYGEAARTAAAGGQADLAQQFFQLDAAQLTTAQRRGEQGASAIYAALALPSPEQRATYMQQHRQMAIDAGISPEVFDNADWSDTASLRAVADQWLSAAKLAGDVSLQKFGDRIDPVRTGPAGMEVLPGGKEIPQTRAEALDADRIRYAQQSDQRDFGYRQQRDQADDQYREKALEVRNLPNSPGDVIGPVLAKVQAGGVGSLSEGEKVIFDRWQQSGAGGGANDLIALLGGGAPVSTPAPVATRPPAAQVQPGRGPAPGAVGTQQNPARPATKEAAQALPRGAYFYDPQGNLMQRQ